MVGKYTILTGKGFSDASVKTPKFPMRIYHLLIKFVTFDTLSHTITLQLTTSYDLYLSCGVGYITRI